MTVTKNDICKEMQKNLQKQKIYTYENHMKIYFNRFFTTSFSRLVVDAMFEILATELQKGNSIQIRGFGTFGFKTYKARKAKIPKTGEIIDVPEKTKIFFKPSDALYEFLDDE